MLRYVEVKRQRNPSTRITGQTPRNVQVSFWFNFAIIRLLIVTWRVEMLLEARCCAESAVLNCLDLT